MSTSLLHKNSTCIRLMDPVIQIKSNQINQIIVLLLLLFRLYQLSFYRYRHSLFNFHISCLWFPHMLQLRWRCASSLDMSNTRY